MYLYGNGRETYWILLEYTVENKQTVCEIVETVFLFTVSFEAGLYRQT